ncbi:glycine--tRNA ligase subunit beta [Candidatus Saganbacteria bacterium]|nr:glycine--tRNA ligase subunit beta [Candidatus Saganbacteria bacterium]
MSNVLLEIGCEEIPARFMPGFLKDLGEKAAEKLLNERLTYKEIKTLGTGRRLALYIEGLIERQPDLSEEIKGPPADRAFDKAGQPTQAALGFAKSQGLTAADLIVKPAGKNDYIFAQVTRHGQPTETVLEKLLPEIITALYQPLAMRWGTIDFKFIRPIHWFLALYGGQVVNFELAGIKSSKTTCGHRYVGGKGRGKKTAEEIIVSEADLSLYEKTLAKHGVVVDPAIRKMLIKHQVESVAAKSHAQTIVDPVLLDEVTFLVEQPQTYIGEFNPDFLGIPQDVLITSMKKNQKYFPVVNAAGKLQARFVFVTDGCAYETVAAGNEKVLSARLSDAKFFFEEDQKVPLTRRQSELEKVGYFEKLGTLAHKTERLVKLSEWLGKRLKLSEDDILIARRVAQLCKVDLTTKMVYEFPELQGMMGREYALLAKDDPQVAQGIYEHYLPRFSDDKLPQTLTGTVVALADRIDSLVGCFSLGALPTGSADPYGLRRAANGIIKIILDKKLDLLLDELIEYSYKLYEPVFLAYLFEKGEIGYQDFARIKKQLLEFIAGRLRPMLLEAGRRYDLVDAALSDCNDILDCATKAAVLTSVVDESCFAGIVRSADRISRLAEEAAYDTPIEADLIEPEEKKLFKEYMSANWAISEATKNEDWLAALRALAKLTEPVEAFFVKVLVMHENPRVKSNRLALLKALDKLYRQIADFQKVVLQK